MVSGIGGVVKWLRTNLGGEGFITRVTNSQYCDINIYRPCMSEIVGTRDTNIYIF